MNQRLFTLRVVESGAGLEALHPEERELLGNRATPKRVHDFVAGRLAARRAIASHLGISSAAIEVLRYPGSGAPRVRVDGEWNACEVSITHEDGVAVAVASSLVCAVDLVRPRDWDDGFVRDTFTRQELEHWAAVDGKSEADPTLIASAFAAKECALKWLKTGMNIPLQATSCLPMQRRAPGLWTVFRCELRYAGVSRPVGLWRRQTPARTTCVLL